MEIQVGANGITRKKRDEKHIQIEYTDFLDSLIKLCQDETHVENIRQKSLIKREDRGNH